MPRKSKGARLYLDPKRREWIIRDGSYYGRTGVPETKPEWAEKLLSEYIGRKYTPEPSSSPLIADVLNVYLKEHVPHTKAAKNAIYNIVALAGHFGGDTVSSITAAKCREYARQRPPSAGRRDLETLRAAIHYWHREYGPLGVVPAITLPSKAEPRDRWLTRKEARQLRKAAMKWPHLYRFIVIGLLTGSRSGAILALRWDWIDWRAGTMLRRDPRESQDARKRTPPVKMGSRLQRIMRLWHAQDRRENAAPPVYVVHYKGARVSRLQRTWRMAVKAADLQDVTPHTLRHTRATWLMQAGIPIWEAAGALGMTPDILQSTYGKHHPDYQKAAAEV
jgi:integrase